VGRHRVGTTEWEEIDRGPGDRADVGVAGRLLRRTTRRRRPAGRAGGGRLLPASFAGGDDDPNSRIIAETFEAAGHRPRETLQRQGGTSFTYVTDGLAGAVAQAGAVAAGKDVAIAGGGSIVGQALAAGCSTNWSCTSPPSSSARGCGCSTASVPVAGRASS
jgi:hypothetical protein